MNTFRLLFWTSAALAATPASAGETPIGSQRPSQMYYWCMAHPTTNSMPTYVSPIFKDTSNEGQQLLNDGFRHFLNQKYDYPTSNGRVMCYPGTTTSSLEGVKKNELRGRNEVVDSGWTPTA